MPLWPLELKFGAIQQPSLELKFGAIQYAQLSTQSITYDLANGFTFDPAVDPGDDVKVMKGAAFKRVFLKAENFLLQHLKVMAELRLADIEVVFKKFKKDHLHFIEVTHLAEKSSDTVDEMLEQVEVIELEMGHQVHQAGITLDVCAQVTRRLQIENLVEIFNALAGLSGAKV